jgi:hypothetical protein
MSLWSSLKENWRLLVLILALTLGIYGYSLAGKFVFDDRNITENWELLSQKENLGQVATIPYWNLESGLYRPTTALSFSLNIIALGGSAFSFHAVNILLYAFVCFLIFIFFESILKDRALALLGSLLFLILPIHSEVVANISGRGEILALMFSLLALIEVSKEKVNFWLLGLWTVLAIGSKEVAIALLPLILVVIYIKEPGDLLKTLKNNFLNISAPIIAVCIYLVARFFVLGPEHFLGVSTSFIENPLMFTDPLSRIATSLKILWMYFSKTFVPVNLCSDYSFNQIPVLPSFLNYGSLLGFLLILVPVGLIILLRRNKAVLLSSSIFLFSFLPVSNIAFPTGTIAGERLFFFPSLGICLLAALLLSKLQAKLGSKVLWIFLMVGMIYSGVAFQRAKTWTTEEKLFVSAGKCAPSSVLSQSNLGATYLLEGNLPKAKEKLEYAKNITPMYSKGINNLGLVYFHLGQNEKARELYLEALEQQFPYPGAYENLVLLYLSEGNIAIARHWLLFLYPGQEKLVDQSIENYLNSNKK